MGIHVLSLELPPGDTPPREFRIFRAGLNDSTKGPILFDAKAAAAVMAEFNAHGVDLMIDLEHETLRAPIRSDSHDARGWAKLAVRNGELWAVDVTWTPDGARRLTDKTQRYVSPVVDVEKETRRASSLLNIALVAMPATDFAQPLVAASRAILARRVLAATVSRNTMDPKLLQAALDAIESGDQAAQSAALKAMVAALASDGAEDSADGGVDEATEPVAEGADPAAAPAAGATAPAAAPKKKDETMTQQYTQLANDAMALARTQGVQLEKLRTELAALSAVNVKSDNVKRCALVAQLVALGVETPATAWERTAKDEVDVTKPVARLAGESIEAMSARIKALESAGVRPRAATPPAGGDGAGSKTFQTSHGVMVLSASEIKNCEEAGAKLEQYAENKAIREAARAARRAPQ